MSNPEVEQILWQREEMRGNLSIATPDKYMRAYVRADGCINLLFYDEEWLFEHGRHSYDWHICKIDEAIVLLQDIKKQAIAHFAEQGKQWPEE